MPKHSQQPETDIDLDQLLRLKRSERPDDAFWSQFDRELHQRMLQTLVKRDPWYVQVWQGLTGRLVQSAAIGAVAAVLALAVLRPALLSPEPNSAVAAAPLQAVAALQASSEPLTANLLSYSEASSAAGVPDYAIESISVEALAADAAYQRDFGMQAIEVASHDALAYSADSAHLHTSFATSGVASLIF